MKKGTVSLAHQVGTYPANTKRCSLSVTHESQLFHQLIMITVLTIYTCIKNIITQIYYYKKNGNGMIRNFAHTLTI